MLTGWMGFPTIGSGDVRRPAFLGLLAPLMATMSVLLNTGRMTTLDTAVLDLPDGFHLDTADSSDRHVCCALSLMSPNASCSRCGVPSCRIHSIYVRTLADLPVGTSLLHLRVRVRKFFCDNPDCSRRIFAECLPGITRPYARRTHRLTEAIANIGCECGGQAGAHLVSTNRLGTWAPNTVLNIIRKIDNPANYTPRVLGVDDWAMRKGIRYGTLLCDLEQGTILDLLPDRDSATLQAWLEAHPGIEIVSRDRANAFCDALRKGAPQAVQVADRFHLLVNAGDALERVVVRHHHDLRVATSEAQAAGIPTRPAPKTPSRKMPGRRIRSPTAGGATRQAAEARRTLRMERYARIRSLHEEGHSFRQIEKLLSVSQDQIRSAVQNPGLPNHGNRGRRLAPFVPYLVEQCESGNLNARALHRQICAQGYTGHYAAVMQFVTPYRSLPQAEPSAAPVPPAAGQQAAVPSVPVPSDRSVKLTPRKVTWLLRSEPDKLAESDQQRVAQITAAIPELDVASQLTRSFKHVLMNKHPEQLADWLQRVTSTSIPELRRFADGIVRDLDAVLAAISLPWSNGPTEGHVNRLKTVKRQMYGRGNLALLRKRLQHSRQSTAFT